ncbi:MAG: hypothetical protein JW395_0691 [Nitrospira sp.]|nr:hypothetical protein [Nitrospira sp.]
MARESSPIDLNAWCERWLDARPVEVLFERGYLSKVTGLRLGDGRSVVIKMRPFKKRLPACFEAQRHLWAVGYPCPEPLVGPDQVGVVAISVEAYVPGGDELTYGPDSPRLFAEALARLVSLAPAAGSLPDLDHRLPWTWWDHDEAGVWPVPDIDVDMSSDPNSGWLNDIARRVRRRLEAARGLPDVVGHGDFETQNVLWIDRKLHVVHDWDSLISAPEPVIAGICSAVFPGTHGGNESTVGESAEFLEHYQAARAVRWDKAEYELCWAAGLWVRAFNAKKDAVQGQNAGGVARFAEEAGERLRLAGA